MRRHKIQVIRQNRKATVQDYARAQAMASPVIGRGVQDHLLEDVSSIIKGAGDFIKGIRKMSKEQYISQKVELEKAIAPFYNTKWEDIDTSTNAPGFSASHQSALLTNWSKKFKELTEWLQKTYPKAFSDLGSSTGVNIGAVGVPATGGITGVQQPTPTQIIRPMQKTMEQALLNVGTIPPKNTDQITKVFAEKVVMPTTQQDLSNATKEAAAAAATAFIANVAEKQANGEQLPAILEKLGKGANKVRAKIEQNVKDTAEESTGEMFIKYGLPILAGVILLKVFKLI